MTPSLELSTVAERDIDLLLVEEFAISPNFCAWFVAHSAIKASELLSVHHSVTTPNGETDVLLVVKAVGGRVAVLIENKIDAVFQPNQQARYADRATRYVATGDYAAALTIRRWRGPSACARRGITRCVRRSTTASAFTAWEGGFFGGLCEIIARPA